MFRDIAEAEGVTLVPRLMEQVALVPELMQSDGIHPTADGQPLLLDAVWPYVSPLLGVEPLQDVESLAGGSTTPDL